MIQDTILQKEINISYIVELPFKGHIQTRLINGFAEFSGDEVKKSYITKNGSQVVEYSYINQLNFEQYKAKRGGNLFELTEAEVNKLFSDHRDSLITDFTEITEERYFDLLECLPPKRWHNHKGVQIFYISEAYTGDLHTCCGALNGKYFSALRPLREESEIISNLINEAYNKLI